MKRESNTFALYELVQHWWEDGESIQASDQVHFFYVHDRGAQCDGLDVVLLVVVVDAKDMGEVDMGRCRERHWVDGGVEVGGKAIQVW